MYRPTNFAEDDLGLLVGLVRSVDFGHLVTVSGDAITSTPIPFVIDDDGATVRGHLARPNRLWRDAPCRALMIVPVTDAYVSPSWYPSKQVDGRVVPTWNYEVVHAHGDLVAHDDADWIERQVRDLTARNERHRGRPWSVDDAPSDFVARMLRGIVGVELRVDRLEGKRKLSQNMTADDVAGAIDGLEHNGHRAREIATAMRTIG